MCPTTGWRGGAARGRLLFDQRGLAGAAAGAAEAELLTAWRAAGQPAVQALVSDLRLRQGRTGLQVIAALRLHRGGATPARVITGDVAPDHLHLLRDSGLPCWPKPAMPMRLRSWLAGLHGASSD